MKNLCAFLCLVTSVAFAQTVYNTDTVTKTLSNGSVVKEVYRLTYVNGKLTARTLLTSNTVSGPTTSAESNRTSIATKQSAALARGLTGVGSTILIMDSGIDVNHPDLAGKVKYSIDYTKTGIQDKVGHGTHVAGIAAANLNGTGIYGVAPDAKLAIAKITNSTSSSMANAQAALKWAQQYNDIVVANLSSSVGYSTTYTKSVYKLNDGTYYSNDKNYGGTFYYNRENPTAWANVLGKEMVLVVAAGNSALPYVSNPATFASATDTNGKLILNGQMIIAGNWNSTSNRITGQTAGHVCKVMLNNVCKDAYRTSDFYLLAPGVAINSTYLNGTYREMSGSSMAAPAISGAVAVVHQLWPYMKGDQIAQLLFKTANKNLTGYNKEIHGQGLLDLDRATQPVGVVGVSVTGRTGTVVPLSGTLNVSGISSAATAKLASVSVVDEFQRDYRVNLTGAVSQNTFQPTAYLSHNAGQSWSSKYAGYVDTVNGVTVGGNNGTFSVGVSTQALDTKHQPWQQQVTFTQTQHNPWVNFTGMWGESRGATTVEFSSFYSPETTGVWAQAGLMQTSGDYRYGVVSNVSNIISTYAITGWRNETVNLYVGIKPTVVSGSMNLTIPTSVDADGIMHYESVTSKLRNRSVGFVGTSYNYSYRAHTVSLTAMAANDGSYQGGVVYKTGF